MGSISLGINFVSSADAAVASWAKVFGAKRVDEEVHKGAKPSGSWPCSCSGPYSLHSTPHS